MELQKKATAIEEAYGILPDPQERFAYLMEQSAAAEGLSSAERTEENRVQGCISLVWVVAESRDGVVRYRTDADSPLVKGLAWLLEDFYSGSQAASIVATFPDFIEHLGLHHALTENRRRGLAALIRRFQALAQRCLSGVAT